MWGARKEHFMYERDRLPIVPEQTFVLFWHTGKISL